VTLRGALRWIDGALHARRGTRRVLVDGRTPVNYEMVGPVVRAMAADARVSFAFTASAEPHRLREIYRAADRGAWLVTPSRAALTKWDAYLTSDFLWAPLPRGAARIQMFHGVAGKYGFDAPTRSMREWDRLFFINERRVRNCIAAGAIDEDSPAVRLIGMPKVDCLVDGTYQRDVVLRGFGLDPARPTVLYAPTWSPASSLNQVGVELIEGLMTRPINVIVKLHDRSRDPRPQYSGGIDWVARLQPLLASRNGALGLDANIVPCLAAADVLITDHSSCGFEYMLLDRPIVRIEVPELLARANVHPDYVALLADASINARGVPAVLFAVERALAAPQERSAERRAAARELFYKPGTATARCAAALYDAMDLAPDASIAGAAEPCVA
jgi:hypothetical protein